MPNEEELNIDLTMIADAAAGPQAAGSPAEQEPALRLPTIDLGKHLSAEQVEQVMGDEAAPLDRRAVNPDS